MSFLPLGQTHLLDGVQHILIRHVDLFAVVRRETLQVAALTLLQRGKINVNELEGEKEGRMECLSRLSQGQTQVLISCGN